MEDADTHFRRLSSLLLSNSYQKDLSLIPLLNQVASFNTADFLLALPGPHAIPPYSKLIHSGLE